MRNRLLYTMILALMLAVSGCVSASTTPPTATPVVQTQTTTSAAAGDQSGPSTTGGVSAASTPSASAAAATPTQPADAVTIAVQAVIQKANDEQVQAFTKNDPTVMKDTATRQYYDELVSINSDMANGGVSAIKLLKLEWGQVTLTNATTAQATTYETWETTYADGSVEQGRDRNVYTLVQQQGAWKIQSDEHPDSNNPPGQRASNPDGSGSGSSGSAPTAPSSDVSRNWSGYAATGGKFTSVTGTWVVPQSNGSTTFGSSASWVGIGGVSTRDLIQAGTQQVSSGSGTVRYSAWIELLPAAPTTVPLTIRPGESVTVTITQQSGGQWVVVLKNGTTGQTYQKTVRYASSLTSAEWVQEAPSTGRRVVTLDDFGTVQFSAGSAVKDGKSQSLADLDAQPISMIDAFGDVLAAPSALSADGGGFSVSRSPITPNNAQPLQGRGSRSTQPSVPTGPNFLSPVPVN
ncbi:MAG: G1 family glutamic endopeptidase [Chloroflexota bacterium]